MNRFSSGAKVGIGAGLAALLGVGALLRAGSPNPIPAPLPLPSPNGFDRYVAASMAITRANPPVDEINDARILTPAQAAIDYAPARRRAWITANARAWQLLASAKTIPSRHPNLRGVTTNFAAWKTLRELARCQSIRVKEWKTQGNWNAAMNGGLDTLQMGRDIEHGASLIGSLVGMALEAIGERSVEDVPPRLSAAQAKAAARRLESIIGKSQPFSQVLNEEKWTFLVTVDRTLGASGGGAGAVVRIVTSRGRTAFVSTMDNFSAQADKPKLSQQSVAIPSGFGATGIYDAMYPSTAKSLFNDERRNSLERLLLLRLALQAYRAQNGAYPAQLSALAPTFLQKVPVDPFGAGEALRYRASGNSFVAWSIGPDGADQNGAPIAPKPGKTRAVVAPDSSGDIVARP